MRLFWPHPAASSDGIMTTAVRCEPVYTDTVFTCINIEHGLLRGRDIELGSTTPNKEVLTRHRTSRLMNCKLFCGQSSSLRVNRLNHQCCGNDFNSVKHVQRKWGQCKHVIRWHVMYSWMRHRISVIRCWVIFSVSDPSAYKAIVLIQQHWFRTIIYSDCHTGNPTTSDAFKQIYVK